MDRRVSVCRSYNNDVKRRCTLGSFLSVRAGALWSGPAAFYLDWAAGLDTDSRC